MSLTKLQGETGELCLVNIFKTVEGASSNTPINSSQKGVFWKSLDLLNWMSRSPTAAHLKMGYIYSSSVNISYWSQINKSRADLLNAKENKIENQIEEEGFVCCCYFWEVFFLTEKFTRKKFLYGENARCVQGSIIDY